MAILSYAIRRLLLLIPVFFGVTIITFTLVNVVGNPVAAYITSEQQLHDPDVIQRIEEEYGLNDPLPVQYFRYITKLLQGDWGESRAERDPVLEVIGRKLPVTAELTIYSMIIAVLIGIPLGIVAALKKDSALDNFSRVFSLGGISVPIFWLGLLLQYFFYTVMGELIGLRIPITGRLSDDIDPPLHITGLFTIDSLLTLNLEALLDSLAHLILPSVCLSYLSLALLTRMMRSSMLEVLGQDYILLARSKGLTERIVIYRHAMRNALIPAVTVAGLTFGGLLTGAVLTETVFALPGMGRWATRSILSSDLGGIMGFTTIVALIFTSVNLIVDIMYTAIDPRIEL